MVIVDCSVKNKLKRVRFFQKTFLLANISLEIVLEMFFHTLSRANIWFAKQKFVWRTYTVRKTLLTTKMIKIINKSEFATAALNKDNKIFVMHVSALAKPTIMPIYPFCQAQVASLTTKKTGIPAKYFHFYNVFSSDSVAELP